ncbi:DUF4091 domain-containing protein [uncultured Vagococcus sp.]|uniref:DUF4091 domain-containing protein n=1 Tax=uncultured Vagococcus sp. TaxID=189676 RepID=UPI0028D71312|nr:DUF4091 domain-containing protein [uncultured Vagococcus sp.]
MQIKLISSLDKVFVEGPIEQLEIDSGEIFLDELYGFQVAVQGCEGISVEISSPTIPVLSLYEVKQIPSGLPVRENHDEDILKGVPGFYPDALIPVRSPVKLQGTKAQWHSIWVEVQLKDQAMVGRHQIEIQVTNYGIYQKIPVETATAKFVLDVINARLPKQELIHTEWFHTDSLMSYYGIEAFSPSYWEWVEKFLVMAVNHSVNMVLTPLFTPPLDTEIGGERPTVQLVGVTKKGSNYDFDFSQLDHWSHICRKVGVTYLEMSHLFTQWGAKAAPKIVATSEGECLQLFGWKTDAGGEAYRNFLAQFVPALIDWLEEHDWLATTFFHVSDEPGMGDLESYRKASVYLRQLVGDIPVIDALSDYDFYQEGLVDIPIPANSAVQPFINQQISPLWTYYCVSQNQSVSNRFFDMPSSRNRILGYQLYKFDIQGFLHWGYNFYFTQFAKRPVNPFLETDAGGVFPSGDSFLVYPGEDQPLASIRLKVLNEAMQDIRILNLLESWIGKKAVIALLETDISPLKFDSYPKEAYWQIEMRQKINLTIKKYLGGQGDEINRQGR